MGCRPWGTGSQGLSAELSSAASASLWLRAVALGISKAEVGGSRSGDSPGKSSGMFCILKT